MEKNQKNITLAKFLKDYNFSSPIYSAITKELITKYKKESPRQRTIRAVVMLFKETNKEEMEEFFVSKEIFRKTRKNKFAADSKSGIRVEVKLPGKLLNQLYTIIKSKYDTFTFLQSKEEVEWFIKAFPEFQAPEVY